MNLSPNWLLGNRCHKAYLLKVNHIYLSIELTTYVKNVPHQIRHFHLLDRCMRVLDLCINRISIKILRDISSERGRLVDPKPIDNHRLYCPCPPSYLVFTSHKLLMFSTAWRRSIITPAIMSWRSADCILTIFANSLELSETWYYSVPNSQKDNLQA